MDQTLLDLVKLIATAIISFVVAHLTSRGNNLRVAAGEEAKMVEAAEECVEDIVADAVRYWTMPGTSPEAGALLLAIVSRSSRLSRSVGKLCARDPRYDCGMLATAFKQEITGGAGESKDRAAVGIDDPKIAAIQNAARELIESLNGTFNTRHHRARQTPRWLLCLREARVVAVLEWVGVTAGILGAIALALNTTWSGWGYIAFLLGSLLLLAIFVAARRWAQVALWTAYTLINLVGIYRWLVAP